MLTGKGERMRVEIERRAGEPPPRLRSLSEEDAIALRDILARALADG